MAGPGTTERFDQLATTTLNVYAKKSLQDQIFQADPIMSVLYSKGAKGKETLDGGRYIEVPLMYAKNDTGESYSGLEVANTEEQEGFGNALYPWAFYRISIVVDEADLLKNSGDAAIIKLLESKIRQAELSAMDDLATMFYGDGTGNANKDMLGLQAIVAASGTLAGIDSSTHTWWVSQTDTVPVALDESWMRTMVNNCRGSGAAASIGGASVGKVDLIITTQDLYESYESKLVPTLRNQDTKLGDLGFDALKFKGAEITWSDNCPTGYMYFLSTEYMKLYTHKQRDFSTTPFMKPHNQDGRIAYIQVMGNLTTSNRRRLGVATNKTA